MAAWVAAVLGTEGNVQKDPTQLDKVQVQGNASTERVPRDGRAVEGN